MKKVLIAADEVDKWSRLCEGLQTEWECTTVNLDVFEKFHTIAVYDAVLIREKQKIIQKGKLLIDWCYHTVYWGEHELATLNEREKAFLYLLAESSRQVVIHEIIIEQLWKEPYGDDSANMIWCFVRRLRKKMEKTEPEAAKIIQSIRKVGYYLDIDRH